MENSTINILVFLFTSNSYLVNIFTHRYCTVDFFNSWLCAGVDEVFRPNERTPLAHELPM